MLYCITDIVGTPTPGAYISKGGIDVEMGGGGGATFLLHYSSITFTVCDGQVRFPLTFWIFSLSS